MARSVDQIRVSIIRSLVSVAAALNITIDPNKWVSVPGSLSQTDQKLLLLDTVADAQSFEEQLNDAFVSDIEAKLTIVAPQTPPWFQYRAINVFQFNITDPQIPFVTPNFVIKDGIKYSIIIPSFTNNQNYKIIKYCSVKFVTSGRVLIKIAAQVDNLPAQIDDGVGGGVYPGSLAAYQAFVNSDAAPGISYVAISNNADQLFLQLDIYYKGAFSTVIFGNVKTAIINFLNSLAQINSSGIGTLDGIFILSSFEIAIRSVTGVTDYIPVNIGARNDATSFSDAYSGGYNLVNNLTELFRLWNLDAGYIKLEKTSGQTLSDFRTGSSGPLNLNCIPV